MSSPEAVVALDIHQILKVLPHRYPFLLVDKVLELRKGDYIKAQKNVTMNEPCFTGHFPHRPVLPGVMILESMAQAGAILSMLSAEVGFDRSTMYYFAGIDQARFKKPVEPGHTMMHEVKLTRAKATVHKYVAKTFVDGQLMCEAELMCAIQRMNPIVDPKFQTVT